MNVLFVMEDSMASDAQATALAFDEGQFKVSALAEILEQEDRPLLGHAVFTDDLVYGDDGIVLSGAHRERGGRRCEIQRGQ